MGTSIFWWIVAGVVVSTSALYLLSLLRAWRLRRNSTRAPLTASSSPASNASSPTDEKGVDVTTRARNSAQAPRSGVAASYRAARAVFNNYAYVRVFPLWIFSHSTTAEWWWTAAYTGITLGLGFWSARWRGKMDIANPMGIISFAQLPLIVGLASKNNVLSLLTGISYEKLNYLHRASGRVCVLTSWIHWAAWVHKGLGKHGPGSQIFLTGVLGVTALTLMFLTSFAMVRRVMYEMFLVVHILMGIIFMVGVYFHAPSRWFQLLVWPALFLWGLDRFVSFGKMVIVNKAWLLPFSSKRNEHSACTVHLVSPDVVRLHVTRPLFHWRAGQHAFITMPGVARLRYEQHPFTVANIPNTEGEAVFLIRAQTGFTRRLVNRLEGTKGDMNCYLEGPYGTPHDLNHYAGVILLGGGTGVTYGLAHLASIIKASREGRSTVAKVRLVWNVRDEDNVQWIAPILNGALAQGTGEVQVHVDIFVTRSHMADEPNAEDCPLPHPHLGNEVTPAETPMFSPPETPGGISPDTSPKESPKTSSEHQDDFVNDDVKKALRLGLGGVASQVTKFHRGRSNVEILLRTDIDTVPVGAAGIAVGVCGPTSLMLDARRAVCRVNTASAVFNGQNPVDLYSETFGW